MVVGAGGVEFMIICNAFYLTEAYTTIRKMSRDCNFVMPCQLSFNKEEKTNCAKSYDEEITKSLIIIYHIDKY